MKSVNPGQEEDGAGKQNLYKRFTNLKRSHPHLRTLLAVGGWIDGSEKYSLLAADAVRRSNFARNSAAFLKKYNFDGLHFHWEHPAHRGAAPQDKQNFPLLLKELKEVYKPHKLYLSAFLRTQSDVVEKAYDVPNIARFVDAVLLMTFDYVAFWDRKVGFPAALHGSGEGTVESRVNYFKNQGVPVDKIILGIPFFGRSFVTNNDGGIGAPAFDGFPGPFVKDNGFLGYNEICHLRKDQAWDISFDSEVSQAIGKFNSDGTNKIVVFESPRSVANKVQFAVENNLGGVWAWFVDTDDFRGDCPVDTTAFSDFDHAPPQTLERDYPLLRTINHALRAQVQPQEYDLDVRVSRRH